MGDVSSSSKALEGQLRSVFADTYSLYFLTQGFHWNVEGSHFWELHELFESQFVELAEAIDEIAERIRILGNRPPHMLSQIESMSSIPHSELGIAAEAMLEKLLDAQGLILQTLRTALQAATSVADDVTIGLLTDRMQVHQKNSWVLKSTLAYEANSSK